MPVPLYQTKLNRFEFHYCYLGLGANEAAALSGLALDIRDPLLAAFDSLVPGAREGIQYAFASTSALAATLRPGESFHEWSNRSRAALRARALRGDIPAERADLLMNAKGMAFAMLLEEEIERASAVCQT